jgi:hypothetical protein
MEELPFLGSIFTLISFYCYKHVSFTKPLFILVNILNYAFIE